jgi:hypothetical protein
LAMDDYVAALIPDWEYTAYALDFTPYHVEERHEYPRFLCYDCHGFRPYYSWNPYRYTCSSFRVVIYNDPYYYPATRYRGTRVVYVRPRRGTPQFAFKERARGEPGSPQVVMRNPGSGSPPGVEGTENRRAVPRTSVQGGGASGSATIVPPRGGAGVRGTATRRTGGTGSVTTPPRPSEVTRRGTERAAPPTLPRTDRTGSQRTGTVRSTDPGNANPQSRVRGTSRPTLERRTPTTGSRATSRAGTSTVRPSSKVRSGGSTSSAVRRGGSTVRSSGSVRSGGTTGSSSSARSGRVSTSSRTPPTVRSAPPPSTSRARSGGATSRSSGTVRRSGGTSRPPPSVRSSGASRTPPKVRSSGGSARSSGTVRRSGGGTSGRATTTSTRRRSGGGL